NTGQPAAPMTASSHSGPDANSAGQTPQGAAAMTGPSAPPMQPGAAPVAGTSCVGSGGSSKGGGRLLADGGGSGGSSQSSGPASAALAASFGQLPLPFELNAGQSDPSVVALANG